MEDDAPLPLLSEVSLLSVSFNEVVSFFEEPLPVVLLRLRSALAFLVLLLFFLLDSLWKVLKMLLDNVWSNESLRTTMKSKTKEQ